MTCVETLPACAPRPRGARRRLALLAALTLLSACGTAPPDVVSFKKPDYEGPPKRLLIIANMGTAVSPSEDEGLVEFTALVQQTLAACGTVAEFQLKDPLALRDSTPEHVMAFKPDALMDIHWTTAQHGGGTYITNYSAQMYAVGGRVISGANNNALVWNATIKFWEGGHAGKRMTHMLLDRLKTDGVIGPTCVVPPAS